MGQAILANLCILRLHLAEPDFLGVVALFLRLKLA